MAATPLPLGAPLGWGGTKVPGLGLLETPSSVLGGALLGILPTAGPGSYSPIGPGSARAATAAERPHQV